MSPRPAVALQKIARRAGAHAGALLVLAVLAGAVFASVGQGLGSVDAHGIVNSVQRLVHDHAVVASRPPGHPATEFYLLGAVAWGLQHLAGRPFDATAYLVAQGVAAVLAGAAFYLWLLQKEIGRGRATLALVALVATPQFLAQAVNGEEFLWSLVFLLVALLGGDAWVRTGRRPALLGSLVAFAVAAGCRVELVLLGVQYYPLLLFVRRPTARELALAASVTLGAFAVVWAPLWLTRGLAAPYASGIGWREALFVWGYKLAFDAFGLPLAIMLYAALLAIVWRKARRGRAWLQEDFGDAVATFLAVSTTLWFLAYATKPAFLLTALPFLLQLAARRGGGWMLAVVVAALFGCWRQVDVVRERRVVGPHLAPGAYAAAVAGKPAQRVPYLEALTVAAEPRVALIGDFWSWEMDYATARGALPEWQRDGRGPAAWCHRSDPTRIVLARDATVTLHLLVNLRHQGYAIAIDRALWRTLFMRYALAEPDPDHARLADGPVHLVAIRPAP